LPEYRGEGIGRTLLKNAAGRARAMKNQSFIYAYINEISKDFYTKHGWTVGEPHHGVAWIPEASFTLWEEEMSAGAFNTRRMMSSIRVMIDNDNPDFTRLA
ncbi:GNAT family N-acetyltransferase, partial [Providencia sp. NPDC089768]|uniref:GNAT family N-acetyltransferase n=1 Tax=Providencia sp. NPDC089768 TaxID=3414705 RepID=UPI003C2BD723